MPEEQKDVIQIPVPRLVRTIQHKAEEVAEVGLGHAVNAAETVKEGAQNLGVTLEERRKQREKEASPNGGDLES